MSLNEEFDCKDWKLARRFISTYFTYAKRVLYVQGDAETWQLPPSG